MNPHLVVLAVQAEHLARIETIERFGHLYADHLPRRRRRQRRMPTAAWPWSRRRCQVVATAVTP